MSKISFLVHKYFNHKCSRCGRIFITRLREFEAVWTVERDHRRIQRDSNSRGLFKRVRSFRDNPREIGVYFDILGETASFLIHPPTKGSCNLIADLHGNAEVGSDMHDDPCEVASEDCSRDGGTPGIYR
jgi:hypothetical protein